VLGKDLLYHATLGNPSMNAWFFRTSVFAQIGIFDASYKVAGDREFMLRLACQWIAVRADTEVDLPISDSSGFDDIRRQRGNMGDRRERAQ